MLIEAILDEKQQLESRILKYLDEVPFDLFSEWMGLQQKIGEYLTDVAFSFIAKKRGAYIVTNPVNPAAYAHFIRPDVQSKTFLIRKQTLKNGMSRGFLEPDTQNIPLQFWIQGEPFYAVEREGQECLVKRVKLSDRQLNVSCYEDNSLIVSDVDLISIISKNNSDIIELNSMYGELTKEELLIIEEINRYFQRVVSLYCSMKSVSKFKIIAHGPANRFSHSKASHLHYPMKVYKPDASIDYLEGEFIHFQNKIESLGYPVYCNPKWELVSSNE